MEWSTDKNETKKLIISLIKGSIDTIEICCEGFLILSIITDNSIKILLIIFEIGEEDKKVFGCVIKEIMEKYKDKEKELKKLSQSISHLPVEDILMN